MEPSDHSLSIITQGLAASVKRKPNALRFVPDRTFIVFWLGQTCATFGDAIAYIAFPLLVLQATGSVAQMGLVTAIVAAGRLGASVVAGSVVDRFDRHLVLVVSALGAAMCYAAVPFVWWRMGPSMPLLFAVAAPIGALGTLIQIGGTAVLPDLVDGPFLTAANSRVQTTGAIAFLAGPLVAGLVTARLTPAVAVGLESFAYLCCLWLWLGVRLRSSALPQQLTSDAFAGLRFLWRDPLLRWVAPLNAIQVVVLAGTIDLLIYRVRHDLGQSATTLGVIFGGAALGAIIAGIIAPTLRTRLGFGVCFLGGLLLEGALLLGLGQAGSIGVVTALGVGFVFGDTIILITSQVVQQERTPTPLLGRVTAAYQVLIALGSPFGAAATTALAARYGTPPVIIGIGALIGALGLVGWLTPARGTARTLPAA